MRKLLYLLFAMSKLNKSLEVLLHLFIWACLLHILEIRVSHHALYLDQYKDIGYFVKSNAALWYWYTGLILFKAIFLYLNIYLIFPKYLKSHQHFLFPVLGTSLLCMLTEFSFFYVSYLYFSQNLSLGFQLAWNYHYLNAQILPFSFLLLLSYGYWAARQWVINRNKFKLYHAQAAELNILKSQIKPHFLFNTLNNLFSMAIEHKADDLAESIAHLTEMMRYTIYENSGNWVALDKEISYIQNYIKLQELRFMQDEVPISFQLEGNMQEVYIAPMLLINFVENAFKHGISLKKPSFIDIEIFLKEDKLHFSVKNSIHRTPHSLDQESRGLGLCHTQKMLALQYPDQHMLDKQEKENSFEVLLEILYFASRRRLPARVRAAVQLLRE